MMSATWEGNPFAHLSLAYVMWRECEVKSLKLFGSLLTSTNIFSYTLANFATCFPFETLLSDF